MIACVVMGMVAGLLAGAGGRATSEPAHASGIEWTATRPRVVAAWTEVAAFPASGARIEDMVCPTADRCTLVGSRTSDQSPGEPFVMTTANGGASWMTGTVPAHLGAVRSIDCGSPTICLATTVGHPAPHVIRSDDGGATWADLAVGEEGQSYPDLACPTIDRCLLVGYATQLEPLGASTSLFTTVDGGYSWTDEAQVDGSVASTVECVGEGRCLWVTTPYLEIGTDVVRRQASVPPWSQITSGPGFIAELRCDAGGTCVTNGYYGSRLTTDAGATWRGVGPEQVGCRGSMCLGLDTFPGLDGARVTSVQVSLDGARSFETIGRPPSGTAATSILCVTTRRCFVLGAGGSQAGTALWRVDLSPVPAVYEARTPARLLDTRVGSTTADGLMSAIGLRSAGQITELPLAGRPGVPAGADVVTLNVTVTEAVADGYVAVFPCGSAPPEVSNLNFVAGQTVANAVLVKIGSGGAVCLLTSAPTHVLVDAGGGTLTGAPIVGLTPRRMLDTRPLPTFDGLYSGIGERWAGSMITVPISSRLGDVGGTPIAAMLNVTVTNPRSSGYVTVYPCGERPNASNLNVVAGQTVANAVVAPLGSGSICIFTSMTADVVVDLSGVYLSGSAEPVTPARVLDTRPGQTTVDGKYAGIGARTAGAVTVLPVTGRGGVGADAAAVALNVTVTEPVGSGYVTVFPCGSEPPNASTINVVAGQTAPNAVVVGVGSGGAVCVLSTVGTHLLVDVNAWFVATPNL